MLKNMGNMGLNTNTGKSFIQKFLKQLFYFVITQEECLAVVFSLAYFGI